MTSKSTVWLECYAGKIFLLKLHTTDSKSIDLVGANVRYEKLEQKQQLLLQFNQGYRLVCEL